MHPIGEGYIYIDSWTVHCDVRRPLLTVVQIFQSFRQQEHTVEMLRIFISPTFALRSNFSDLLTGCTDDGQDSKVPDHVTVRGACSLFYAPISFSV